MEKPEESKKGLKIFFLCLGIALIFVISIVVVVSNLYSKMSNKLASKQEDNMHYRELVQDELKNKYNKEFELSLHEKGYKSKHFTLDGSTGCNYGSDKDVEEYVYKVYSKEEDIISYITLWHNTENNDIEINEINGADNNNISTSYEMYYETYKENILVEEGLLKIIKKTYVINKSKLSYVQSNRDIIIDTNETFEDEYRTDQTMYDNMFDETAELLKEVLSKRRLINGCFSQISVVFVFTDKEVRINRDNSYT